MATLRPLMESGGPPNVSRPLEARRTADLLIERGFPSIQGDQDRRLVELDLAGTSNRADYKQLDRNHLDRLAQLQPPIVRHSSRRSRR